jgi:hypothetical protein
MKPLRLKHLAPVVVRHCDWQEQEDGSLRCGNVVIRCDEREMFGEYEFKRWYIYRVEKNGKMVRVHPKSRPWGYSRAGQAKIGASHLAKPIDAE